MADAEAVPTADAAKARAPSGGSLKGGEPAWQSTERQKKEKDMASKKKAEDTGAPKSAPKTRAPRAKAAGKRGEHHDSAREDQPVAAPAVP
ncbi:MAG: hypothetical protein K8J09_04830, partial [Planctomycetes bacterium]|nr:hypothetical protein [Planctomycetota bacterium]